MACRRCLQHGKVCSGKTSVSAACQECRAVRQKCEEADPATLRLFQQAKEGDLPPRASGSQVPVLCYIMDHHFDKLIGSRKESMSATIDYLKEQFPTSAKLDYRSFTFKIPWPSQGCTPERIASDVWSSVVFKGREVHKCYVYFPRPPPMATSSGTTAAAAANDTADARTRSQRPSTQHTSRQHDTESDEEPTSQASPRRRRVISTSDDESPDTRSTSAASTSDSSDDARRKRRKIVRTQSTSHTVDTQATDNGTGGSKQVKRRQPQSAMAGHDRGQSGRSSLTGPSGSSSTAAPVPGRSRGNMFEVSIPTKSKFKVKREPTED